EGHGFARPTSAYCDHARSVDVGFAASCAPTRHRNHIANPKTCEGWMRHRTITTLLLALLAFVSVAAAASAATLYVDPSSVGGVCSDTYSPAQAQSTSTPWCSLRQATAYAPDGSTVQVRRSIIPFTQVHWPRGYGKMQNRSAYVTFEPYGYGTSAQEGVTIDGLDLIGVD